MGAQPCARSRFADVNQELVREMATKTVQLNTLEAALAARKKDADERSGGARGRHHGGDQARRGG